MMPETYSGCATYASDEETRLTSDFDRSITLGRRGGWRRFRDRRARSMVEKSMVDLMVFVFVVCFLEFTRVRNVPSIS